MEVRAEPERESGPRRQQPGRVVERHAVDEVAQQQAAARVAVRDQRQGREEVLAELAVGGPRVGRLGDLEGKAVDQDRSPLFELNVEGAGVLQPHPGREGARLELKRQQRRFAQLAERPLVGV
jgi:hypothetical protein